MPSEALLHRWKVAQSWVIAVCSTFLIYIGYLIAKLSAFHWAVGVVISLVSVGASVLLMWVRLSPRGRTVFSASWRDDWSGTVSVVSFLVAGSTAGFSAASTVLYGLGIGTVKGGRLADSQVVDAAYNSYLWHLLNAVPLLEIPKTLNWKLAHPFTDHVQGALGLVYTVVVIAPMLYILASTVTARFETKSDE